MIELSTDRLETIWKRLTAVEPRVDGLDTVERFEPILGSRP
jgi:hypothetical protein